MRPADVVRVLFAATFFIPPAPVPSWSWRGEVGSNAEGIVIVFENLNRDKVTITAEAVLQNSGELLTVSRTVNPRLPNGTFIPIVFHEEIPRTFTIATIVIEVGRRTFMFMNPMANQEYFLITAPFVFQ